MWLMVDPDDSGEETAPKLYRCTREDRRDWPQEKFDDLLWQAGLKLHDRPLWQWTPHKFLERLRRKTLIVSAADLPSYFEHVLRAGCRVQFQVTPGPKEWRIVLETLGDEWWGKEEPGC